MDERYELIESYLQECVNNDIYTEEFANEILELAYDKYIIEEVENQSFVSTEIKKTKSNVKKKIAATIAIITACIVIIVKLKKEKDKKTEIKYNNLINTLRKKQEHLVSVQVNQNTALKELEAQYNREKKTAKPIEIGKNPNGTSIWGSSADKNYKDKMNKIYDDVIKDCASTSTEITSLVSSTVDPKDRKSFERVLNKKTEERRQLHLQAGIHEVHANLAKTYVNGSAKEGINKDKKNK